MVIRQTWFTSLAAAVLAASLSACATADTAPVAAALDAPSGAQPPEAERADDQIVDNTLDGTSWRLVQMWGQDLSAIEPPMTMIIRGTRVSGDSACNRYFMDLLSIDPPHVAFGPVGSTRKMCAGEEVMTREQDFIDTWPWIRLMEQELTTLRFSLLRPDDPEAPHEPVLVFEAMACGETDAPAGDEC